MREVLVFDVDGTLTPPRAKMDEAMARCLRRLGELRSVFLVTGSDIGKLRQQVPGDILAGMRGLFVCSGNELWTGDKLVYSMSHTFPDAVIAFAREVLAASPYKTRAGCHVEERTGTLNLSVVGRRASVAQRRDYLLHDRRTGERLEIARAIEARFPDYEAHCGGQISIDVAPRGWNKGRVVAEIRNRTPERAMHFFGDNVCEGGNDRPFASALAADGPHHRVHPVADWRETLAILEAEYLQVLARGEVA